MCASSCTLLFLLLGFKSETKKKTAMELVRTIIFPFTGFLRKKKNLKTMPMEVRWVGESRMVGWWGGVVGW